jgi:DNA-binding Lrp family transcriptional regulator
VSKQGVFWALSDVHTDDAELKLLVILMGYKSNGEGKLWDGQEALARATGLSVITVKRRLKKLKDAGVIQIEAKRAGKHKTRNSYALAIGQVFYLYDSDPPEGIPQIPATPLQAAIAAVDKYSLKVSERDEQAGAGDQRETDKPAGTYPTDTFERIPQIPVICNRNISNRDMYISGRYVMHREWQPQPEVIEALAQAQPLGVPKEFAADMVAPFRLYWREVGGKYDDKLWHEKFIAHVLKNWGWFCAELKPADSKTWD